MQYQLIIKLQKERMSRLGSDQELLRKMEEIFKDIPVAVQFQDEMWDLREMIRTKMKQQKSDEIIESTEKYFQELKEVFKKMHQQKEIHEKLLSLQDQLQKKEGQIQILTLENIQLEDHCVKYNDTHQTQLSQEIQVKLLY